MYKLEAYGLNVGGSFLQGVWLDVPRLKISSIINHISYVEVIVILNIYFVPVLSSVISILFLWKRLLHRHGLVAYRSKSNVNSWASALGEMRLAGL